MKAMVFEGEGRLELKEVDLPKIRKPHEVLLKVDCVGICGTDLHILSVPPGHPATAGAILGHEYVGTVVEVGSEVSHLQKGDRVVVDPNLTCGVCEECRRGHPNWCGQMTTLGIFINGGMAPYNVAPVKALHPIDKKVPIQTAVFAEPLSCVVNAGSRIHTQPGQSALILGGGPIGLLFIQYLRAKGIQPISVMEQIPLRITCAKTLGTSHILNPEEGDIETQAKQIMPKGYPLVIDAVGSFFQLATRLVAKGGEILLFGMNEQSRQEVQPYFLTRHEITIYGSFISKGTFPPAVTLLESGLLNVERMVTKTLPLEDIKEGFELMRAGKAIKILAIT